MPQCAKWEVEPTVNPSKWEVEPTESGRWSQLLPVGHSRSRQICNFFYVLRTVYPQSQPPLIELLWDFRQMREFKVGGGAHRHLKKWEVEPTVAPKSGRWSPPSPPRWEVEPTVDFSHCADFKRDFQIFGLPILLSLKINLFLSLETSAPLTSRSFTVGSAVRRFPSTRL